MNKGDVESELTYFHPNAVITWHNAEVSRGRDGIRSYLNRMLQGPNKVVESYKADVNVDELTILYGGNTGISFGSAVEHFKLANGKNFDLPARWSATLVKEGDKWLIANLHASDNLFDNPLLDLTKRDGPLGDRHRTRRRSPDRMVPRQEAQEGLTSLAMIAPAGDLLETRPLPTAGELREFAAREGIDAATTWLYRSLLESPFHGPFIRRIEETCKRPTSTVWNSDAILVIVPGAFYRENPGSGADGQVLREQAESLGCPTDLVPLASTGSLKENARILCDWLTKQPARPMILTSLSKGGADVKMALAEPDAEHAFRNVVVWISLCGVLDGTPMAEWLLSPWNPGAVLSLLYYWLRGQSTSFLPDLRYGPGQPLDFKLRLPAHMRLISVVGFPLREHLDRGISRRCHRRLTPLGPNDGALVLADVCALPGLVYPLWGADHYLQPKSGVHELVAAILQDLGESPQ